MAMDGDPDISLPTNVIHDFHVTFDPLTEKFVGLPESWTSQFNSNNTLFISNQIPSAILDERDMDKSSGVEITMSMEGDPNISSPRNVKHKLHVTLDRRTGTIVGMPASWCYGFNPDNSLSNSRELDIHKTSCEEMTMSTDGDPDISPPRNLIHNFHITHDPFTRKFVGLPASRSWRLNSDNSLSITNDMDIYRSSGIKDLKYAAQEISYPFSVRHPRLDSAPVKIMGTHKAWNSSTIPMTHMDKPGEALLGALRCHGATIQRDLYAHFPSRITVPISVEMASRSCNYSRSTAGNMRADIDHTEAVYIHKQLAMLAESVGIIISPTVCGTGFRIGPNYVMTAKHVVDQIIKETPTVLTNTMQPSNEFRLQNADVLIDFELERNGQRNDGKHIFYFEPDIVYANDNLDTVILKLKPDAKKYPPPLIQFSALTEQTSHGYFVGHPRADIKRTDRYKRVTLTPYDIDAAKIWSLNQANVDGFVGMDDPRRVLLHCSFGKGASGAPGFWICPTNGQAYVVLMLVRGYPDWFYDDNHPAATKVGVPFNHLVEQGVPMQSIYKDMLDNACPLWEEIFSCV